MASTRAIPLVAAALVAVAGCSTAPAPTPPPVRPPVSLPPAAPPAPGQCTTEQLTMAHVDSYGAAGTLHGLLVFTNHGRACNLRGWPAVTYTDRAGHPVFAAERTDLGDGQAPALVHLPAGGKASARFIYVLGVAGSQDEPYCPRYAHTTVTAPGATGGRPLPDAAPNPNPRPDLWQCQPSVGVVTPGVPNDQ